MFVDISPPAGTRVVGAQVARERRHGREAGLGTWVCEQRVSESEAATNGVRETVVRLARDDMCYTSVKVAASWAECVGDVRQHLDRPLYRSRRLWAGLRHHAAVGAS